jgi:Flp pilus assembly pilin Flp
MINALALRLLFALRAFTARVEDEEGQTLAEYGLMMAIVAVAVIVTAVIVFRDAIAGRFTEAANCLNGTSAGCS